MRIIENKLFHDLYLCPFLDLDPLDLIHGTEIIDEYAGHLADGYCVSTDVKNIQQFTNFTIDETYWKETIETLESHGVYINLTPDKFKNIVLAAFYLIDHMGSLPDFNSVSVHASLSRLMRFKHGERLIY